MTPAPDDVAGSVELSRRFQHETLAFLSGLVEVTGAVFYGVDPELNAVDHAMHRLGTERLPAYVEHFHRLDPLHPRRFAAGDHTVVPIDDTMPRAALERSEYFREFLRPIGVYHEVELFLRDGRELVAGISLLRSRSHPSFTASELALLAKVRPYVEYSFGIERRIDAAARDVGGLTPREAEVARLVCAGASNLGIGRELGIALPTVKTHLEHVYAKLGVRTRAQLVARLASTAGRRAH